MVANELCGVRMEEEGGYGIDHQSAWVLPRAWKDPGVDLDFFHAFQAHLMRDDVAVLGGNDNDGYHPNEGSPASPAMKLPRECSSDGLVARQDGAYWTLFNRGSGAKIRMSFDDQPAPHKATRPELVDLKITDYCPFGCSYCLDPDTKVLKSDLTWAPIKGISVSDELFAFAETPPIGTKDRRVTKAHVEQKWSTRKPAVRVVTDAGSFICSLDHRWLMKNTHRWLHTRDLKLGHQIMFTVAPWKEGEENKAYKTGYLSGLSCGDGTARWQPTKNARQVYWSVRMVDREAVDRAARYVEDLGISIPGISTYEKKSGSVMYRLEARARASLNQLEPVITLDAKSTDPDYMRGWLAGFLDAEGSFSKCLRFHQKTTDAFLDITEKWLNVFGFECTNTPGSEVRPLGGRWEALRLIALIRPAITRKFSALYQGGMKCFPATVLKLEALPEQELVDIQTSTGTFIAEGFASHNCYQGSTLEGKHATLDQVREVLTLLASWKVFEVAIGGGEPTLHPDFYEILTTARDHGVVPNFTTKNLAWLHGPMAAAILEAIGSFAFSVESAEDVVRLHEAMEPVLPYYGKATVQYILGIDDTLQNYKSVLDAAAKYHFPITLLGYKSTKRGLTFGERKSGNWIDLAMEHKGRLSIDTVLADKFYNELTAKNVPRWLLTRHDGMFSAYIDCVEQTMHKSSYEETAPTKLARKPRWSGSKEMLIDEEQAKQTFQGWL
jgi:organic radical activating enzyme